MRSRLKSLTYRLGTGLGLQGRLISRRNRPLGAAEAGEGRRVLAAIQGTRVSGLEGAGPGAPGERTRPGEAAA